MYKLFVLLSIVTFGKSMENGLCPSADEYCLRCNNNLCYNCAYSYLNTNNQCQEVTTKINNCISYNQNQKCTGCKEGYDLSNNACT